MSARPFEYSVTIRDETWISSVARFADGSIQLVDERDYGRDALRNLTIEALRDWLDRWGMLTEQDPDKEAKSLLVVTTFEVIGKLLFAFAFPDEVATNLDIVRNAARDAGRTLRLSLQFIGRDHERIAGYPWEFLYENGIFLASATTTNVVLSRETEDERAALLTSRGEVLRILFVVALPDCGAFDGMRQDLLLMSWRFSLDEGTVGKETIETWDSQAVRRNIDGPLRPHVLHVFGVCRTRNGGIQIAVEADAKGTPQWNRDPDRFATELGAAVGDHKPPLLVLHLCQATDVDYAATFGVMAPLLVRKGFPAVLAMQYPLPMDPVTTDFAKVLYARLAAGEALGTAVQKARGFLGEDSRSHLFAAPILYLQSEDGVFVDPPRPNVTGPTVDVGVGRGGHAGHDRDVTRELREVVDHLDHEVVRNEMSSLVDGIVGWSRDEVRRRLSAMADGEDSERRRKALLAMRDALESRRDR